MVWTVPEVSLVGETSTSESPQESTNSGEQGSSDIWKGLSEEEWIARISPWPIPWILLVHGPSENSMD